jgi:mRNA interferase HigB
MHVITRKRLNEFADDHPETRTALVQWYLLAKRNSFSSFADLKLVFHTADRVGKFTVFDVGGNKVRIVAAIHYNRNRIYIRGVLTHAEYDRGRWKKMTSRGSNFGETTKAWVALHDTVYVPHTEEQYDRLVKLLDSLIDEVGEDEAHPLASLMEIVGLLIENYEAEFVPELTN